ncbi:hypothetical protein TNCV_2884541 [Trichonephila clavipes]|nr:hypothetical protein TNCV_2884541 [Trichonephila clavipes]
MSSHTRSVRIKDRSPITPVARPELPFQVVNMDLIGPIDPPSSKRHKYILCLVDQRTRWCEAVPLTSLRAKVTCEALLSIFSRTGIPDVVASDKGTNFAAELTKEFEKRIGSSPRFSTLGYPQSNGLVERVGEKVIVLISDATSKLFARWQGPATIIEKRNPHSFLVEMPDNSTKHIHQNKLRHYVASSNSRQVQELLDLNLIEPSKAKIAHPIVCVAKTDSSIRMCVDFRALNAVTKIPVFPMKEMQELIFIAGSEHWLTRIDLLKGYWQIKMDEESKPLTAFTTHNAVYQWKTMPF